ncbi:MAG: hypothetical protein DVB31_02530 [Verrucomicrobia bacterium]|nr:MAG: hypothetical protein DVB31_02530 [Verrucomicrobiota bacterium]
MNLLSNTLVVSAGATLLALVAGLGVALWAAGCGPRGRRALVMAAAGCLALPPFLAANCWLELTASWRLAWGAERSATAYLPLVAGVLAGLSWPLVAFPVLAAWSRVERADLECLPGLRGWRLFREVLWPVARPAVGVAAVLVFALAAANVSVPTLFQVRVLPEEMWIRFNTRLDAVGAWRAGIPLALVSGLALAWIARRSVVWPQSRGGSDGPEWRRRLGFAWWVAAATGALSIAGSAGFPVVHLLASRRTWSELPGAIAAGHGAIANSMSVAVGAATLVAAVAVGAAWARVPRWMVRVAVWLFLVPGILLASAWVPVLALPGLRWLADSVPVLWIVVAVRLAGIGAALLVARRDAADPLAAEALRSAGAGPARAWWAAVWPQVAPTVAATWYMAFLLALWDVESTVMVQPPGGETLALRIFNLLHYGHAGQVNALCLVLMAVAVVPSVLWMLLPRRHASIGIVAGCLVLAGCAPKEDPGVVPLDGRWFSGVRVIGSRGVAPGQFNKPRSLVCDRDDNLYVSDITGRIQKFDRDGRFVRQWQMPQTDLGKPKGMGLDPQGNVLVVEPHYMRVNHFTPDGVLVAQWGAKGTNAGQFILPRSIGVTSRGEYLLGEYTLVDRIQRFSPLVPGTNGAARALPHFLQTWGGPGDGPGRFNRAEGLGVGPDDTVYVADSCNHRIQVFDAAGRFVREHGVAGSAPGQFSYPYDVRVDGRGNQFVCEFGNSRIAILDANDRPLESVGGPGSAPGRFSNPWAIALDSHGNLYVADSQNHRVQKFLRRDARPTGPAGTVATR